MSDWITTTGAAGGQVWLNLSNAYRIEFIESANVTTITFLDGKAVDVSGHPDTLRRSSMLSTMAITPHG